VRHVSSALGICMVGRHGRTGRVRCCVVLGMHDMALRADCVLAVV
jgi:hypothetical protein